MSLGCGCRIGGPVCSACRARSAMSRTIESQQQQLLALAKRVVDLEAAYLAQGKLIDELLAQHKSALPSDQHGTGEKK